MFHHIPSPETRWLLKPLLAQPDLQTQDLPTDIFEVMPVDDINTTGGRLVPHHPSVRDFVWTGSSAETEFKVGCKRGALAAAGSAGPIKSSAEIIEGSSVTRLSFTIELVKAGDCTSLLDGGNTKELDTAMETVRVNVAKIAREEVTFEGLLGEGVQVR